MDLDAAAAALGGGTKTPNGGRRVRCSAHDDTHASLDLNIGAKQPSSGSARPAVRKKPSD